jgi:hypothetical protein
MYAIYCDRRISQNSEGFVVSDSNLVFDSIDAAIAFIDGE